jgi:hypothetical protein
LYPAAHQRFCFIFRYDAFDSWITDSTEGGSEPARTTPAEAMATSVPAPIAMPTSACASDPQALLLQGRHRGRLVLGPHPGERPVDAQLGGH